MNFTNQAELKCTYTTPFREALVKAGYQYKWKPNHAEQWLRLQEKMKDEVVNLRTLFDWYCTKLKESTRGKLTIKMPTPKSPSGFEDKWEQLLAAYSRDIDTNQQPAIEDFAWLKFIDDISDDLSKFVLREDARKWCVTAHHLNRKWWEEKCQPYQKRFDELLKTQADKMRIQSRPNWLFDHFTIEEQIVWELKPLHPSFFLSVFDVHANEILRQFVWHKQTGIPWGNLLDKKPWSPYDNPDTALHIRNQAYRMGTKNENQEGKLTYDERSHIMDDFLRWVCSPGVGRYKRSI